MRKYLVVAKDSSNCDKKKKWQGAAEGTTDIFTTSVTDPPEIEYICLRNKEAKKKCLWWRQLCVYPPIDNRWGPIKMRA